MASSLVKVLRQGQRAGGLLEQAGRALAVQQGDLHTSTPAQGVLTIPERLQGIPDAADPGDRQEVPVLSGPGEGPGAPPSLATWRRLALSKEELLDKMLVVLWDAIF